MYTAVLALSLAMALAGGGLACRTFRRNGWTRWRNRRFCSTSAMSVGWRTPLPPSTDARSGAGYLSSGADSVCTRVGQAYTRGQWLILGSSTAAFALMREGDVTYSALPESVAAADVQQAAAATDGILLRGETLLLGGVFNTSPTPTPWPSSRRRMRPRRSPRETGFCTAGWPCRRSSRWRRWSAAYHYDVYRS